MYTLDCENEIKSKATIVEVVEDFVTLKKRGLNFLGLCPFHDEKTPSFYVSHLKQIFKCFGCGKSGDLWNFLMEYKNKMSYPEALRYVGNKYNVPLIVEGSQVYKFPEWKNKTDLTPSIVKWFEKRKISQKTLLFAKITDGVESMPLDEPKGAFKEMNTVQFNYFRNNELVNIKYRGTKKEFKLFAGAELILFGLDTLIGKKEAFWVEGEIDDLTLIEAGYVNETMGVVSVPNGASKYRNNLSYINNCIKELSGIEKHHFGFDNDSNGRKLRDEIAERFGKDKCDYIEWKDKKDANEIAVSCGYKEVRECCDNPIKFPLEGAFTISDFSYEIDDLRQNGLERGVSIGLPEFTLRFVKGYITTVTGISGMGKSECVDEICLRLMVRHNWHGAFYSPENKPTELHYSKMARRLVGKSWDGQNKITKEEDLAVRDYLEKKVWFIKPEKDFSLTSVLKSIRELQLRYGLDYFVIDAWNKLEHKESSTDYVSKAMDELALFCETNQLHCFLVAHPVKPQMDKKTGEVRFPQLFDISGSNNFNNKTDNGLSIHLNRKTGACAWHILKVKFSHWGFLSSPEYLYEPNSGRYYHSGFPDPKNWITGQLNVNANELPLDTIFNDSDFDTDKEPADLPF